jgi:hypothetical protein
VVLRHKQNHTGFVCFQKRNVRSNMNVFHEGDTRGMLWSHVMCNVFEPVTTYGNPCETSIDLSTIGS